VVTTDPEPVVSSKEGPADPKSLLYKIYNFPNDKVGGGYTPALISGDQTEKLINQLLITIEEDVPGDIVEFGDDCGMCYINAKDVLPADHFRSCALYKSSAHELFKYETNLSPVGFREESFFSLRAKWLGMKIGVDLSTHAWHFQTPSGGCRYPNYSELVKQDDETFKGWVKKMFKEKGGFQ